VADDTEHMNQSDQELLQRQFTTVFEHLINVLRFELPFILVLHDSDDTVVGNKVVQSGENENVLSAVDFVSSEGAEEGLLYPTSGSSRLYTDLNYSHKYKYKTMIVS